MIDETGKLRNINTEANAISSAAANRPVTAKLHVSPNGNNYDGSSWKNAYTTLPAALNAASTDAEDLTLILLAPNAALYNIDTAGDPTWTGNYEIMGAHRLWTPIRNTAVGATAVMKFTGYCSLRNIAIFQQGIVDGVIFTKNAFRIRHCGFNSEGLTGAATSIHIDGSAAMTQGGIIDDIQLIGHVGRTTGLYINASRINEFKNMHIHKCLDGIHQLGATSDDNIYANCDVGDCDTGIRIAAGNEAHFENITFHHNVSDNVVDSVGDGTWSNIHGQFDIALTPDDFTGVGVDTGDGTNVWTTPLVTVYTNAGDSPFRIIGTTLVPTNAGWHRLQYTADDGVTYFDDLMFDATRREGAAAPSGTEHIFNKGTVIKARSKSDSAGIDPLDIWLEIQEI